MKVYVKSRGYDASHGYQWHELTPETEKTISIPAAYDDYGLRQMIQAEAESYLLGRFGQDLVLLITGVRSFSRMDFISRVIRDSLLWVSENSDEHLMRGIAAQALREPEWLPTLLDRAIAFDDEKGFTVSWELFNSLLVNKAVGQQEPNSAFQIRKLSAASRQELGNELQSTRLPKKQGLLVVVTGINSLQEMVEAKVWRGLSLGVKGEEDWEDRTEIKKWFFWE